jgi:A/G-specific adenine glycosylase
VPTTSWSADFAESEALNFTPTFSSPLRAAERGDGWRRLPGVVRHVFTHFPLELSVYVAEVGVETPAPDDTRWAKISELAGEALPSLMRKVLAHAFDA